MKVKPRSSDSNREQEIPKIALLQIDKLRPHEKGSPPYLEMLKKEILRDGVIRHPIIADEKSYVILDGMHRWLVLQSLGCTLIPVMLVDALHDPGIRVGTRRIHRYVGNSEEEISVEKVISAGVNGNLMEPRSTRHFFPFSKFQEVNIPLNVLKNRDSKDISQYLATATEEESEIAIEDWLQEMLEELEFLTRRKNEVDMEIREFINRVGDFGKAH